MKTKILFTIGIFIFFLSACTETTSDEFCSNPEATCPDLSAIEATSCCTDQSCYWLYDGTKYNCAGVNDCQDAIDQILTAACASPSAYFDLTDTSYENLRAQMQAVTDKLLVEARAAAGCYYE